MSQKLLTDLLFLNYDAELIKEAYDPNAPLVLKNVILQRANAKNQNGRVYPHNILVREAKTYLNEFVAQNRAMGELDHPESPVVNLKNVSHNVIRMEVRGDDLVGDIKILSTPAGNIVRELIKNNIRLGISSRGMGSVKNVDEGTVEVQDDYNLICFDIVSNPSTYGAFINEGYSNGTNPLEELDTLIHAFLSEVK